MRDPLEIIKTWNETPVKVASVSAPTYTFEEARAVIKAEKARILILSDEERKNT